MVAGNGFNHHKGVVMKTEKSRQMPWRTGSRDWLLQRITSIIICLYVIPLLGYWFLYPNIGYVNWHAYLMHPLNRVLGSLCMLAVIIHAAIGLWVVLTDYVHAVVVRKIILMCVHALLVAEAAWALIIMWGY